MNKTIMDFNSWMFRSNLLSYSTPTTPNLSAEQWRNWREGRRASRPPRQAKCNNRSLLSLHFDI